MKYEEEKEQSALISWFRVMYPKYKNLLIHIPNGQNVGARAGARLKSLGLTKGAPDLALFVPRDKEVEMTVKGVNGTRTIVETTTLYGLFIEMKAKKGRVTPEQQQMHLELSAQGYQVSVCYGWDDGRKVIENYMNEEVDPRH